MVTNFNFINRGKSGTNRVYFKTSTDLHPKRRITASPYYHWKLSGEGLLGIKFCPAFSELILKGKQIKKLPTRGKQ
jgi:hypothetical protein